MIMPKGQQLLLPVNPVFIAASLVAALALNMLPLGRVVWTPDWVMVLLVFWGMHQPQRVGKRQLGNDHIPDRRLVEQGFARGKHDLADARQAAQSRR